LRLLDIDFVLPAPDQRPEVSAGYFHAFEPVHVSDAEAIVAFGAAPHLVAL